MNLELESCQYRWYIKPWFGIKSAKEWIRLEKRKGLRLICVWSSSWGLERASEQEERKCVEEIGRVDSMTFSEERVYWVGQSVLSMTSTRNWPQYLAMWKIVVTAMWTFLGSKLAVNQIIVSSREPGRMIMYTPCLQLSQEFIFKRSRETTVTKGECRIQGGILKKN